jgi:hypothetical protein
MRDRKEIWEERDCFHHGNGARSEVTYLQLEVLLDIRDLLLGVGHRLEMTEQLKEIAKKKRWKELTREDK